MSEKLNPRKWYEVKFYYDSTDEVGNPIRLSGYMLWPMHEKCNVILYCPYTHTSVKECATATDFVEEFSDNNFGYYFFSNLLKGNGIVESLVNAELGKLGDKKNAFMNSLEKLSFLCPNWIIIPDGEGFGVDADKHTQIYLNHEVWAKQVSDCLQAAWHLKNEFESHDFDYKVNLKDSWKMVVAGTSQGAGTALATMRYMENVDAKNGEKLADLYKLEFANVCCGPYDPALTMKTYFEDRTVSYPCVIPMVIQSMINSYPNIMIDEYGKRLSEKEFYTKEYIEQLMPKVNEKLGVKERDVVKEGEQKIWKDNINDTGLDEINGLFQDFCGVEDDDPVLLSKILRPEVLDTKNPSYAAQQLMKCLEKNSIFTGEWAIHNGSWKPKHYIKYYYNETDNVVPYENSQKLKSYLKNSNNCCGVDVTGYLDLSFGELFSIKRGIRQCLYSALSIITNQHVSACGTWVLSSRWMEKGNADEDAILIASIPGNMPKYVRSTDANIKFDLTVKNKKSFKKYNNTITAILFQKGIEKCCFSSSNLELSGNTSSNISIFCDDLSELETSEVEVLFIENEEGSYLYSYDKQPLTASFDYYNVDLTGSASTDAQIYGEDEEVKVKLHVKNNSTFDWDGPITAVFTQGTNVEMIPVNASVGALTEDIVTFSLTASKFKQERVDVNFTFGPNKDPLFKSPDAPFDPLTYSFVICKSKQCGESLTWDLNLNTNTLTIAGTGAMYTYSKAEEAPWYDFSDCIKSIVIGEGVTSISDHAFEDCKSLYTITSHASPAPIEGNSTFTYVRNDEACLLYAPIDANYSDWHLPASWCITSAEPCGEDLYWRFNAKDGKLQFILNGKTGIHMNDYSSTSVPWKEYANQICAVSIADGISYVGANAFYGLSNLTKVDFPKSPFTVGRGAFAKCSTLESINLGYCESIADNAFYDCASLKSISVDRVDGEVGHTDTSFRSISAEGTLYVHQDVADQYQCWIGSVLPEGWEINHQMRVVTFDVFSHGTATLDGSADSERTVLRGSWVHIEAQPDAGFGAVVVANNKDVTSELRDDCLQINENTHIIVKFWDLTMHAEFIDRIDPITGEPVKDIVSEDEAFDMDNGNTVMDVITSCIADKVKEEAGSAAVGAIGAAVGLVVGGPGGAKVGWDFGYYVAGWAATILEIVKTAFEDCENMTFASKAPQVRSRSIENGSAMEITRSNDFSNMSFIEDFHDKAVIAKDEILALNGLFAEYFGAENWLELVPIEELAKIISAVEEMKDDVISVETLMPYKPQNITDEELAIFAARINNTRSRAAGLRVASNNYIHASQMNQCSQTIAEAEEASKALGYEDTDEMWQTEFTQFYNRIEEQSKSVCATITLQFTQKLVMTRQAFRGTLTVFNGHENSPMRDVRLNLVVSDKQGHVATSHEFQINGQSLKGFDGEVDLGSGWTLDAQATGEATILFIPTKYAAPTEPVEYSFGGTLTYIDPFTDLEVTRDLYPVTLTVKPSPNLDLTYFMQRDILGDNALTTDVVEPMVPAEFALLIHNDGYGDATDVRMTTEQPKIVENEKGLLIDFELLSSQVNGKDKVMALGGSVPADFGTIPAHSTAYAQWMLQASLLGHFTDYNVEATHVTSYGNEDLSLLNEVTIHELIHSLSLTDVDGEPLVGWLVNDVTDANDEPDMLYFSNAETTSVNMLSEEQMNMGAVDNDNVSVTLSVGVAQAGWYYGCLVDPMAGRARITAVTRQSDGASIDPQNFWLTEYTLVDGKDPIQEYMLHFADTISTTSETYTIAFEMLPEEMLSVTAFTLPDKGDSSIYPDYVTTVGITFSKAIDPATFTIDDLKLTCRGKTIDLNGVTLSTEDNTTFTMDLTGLTTEDGYYVLTVQTADITDATGYNGQAGKSVDWTQFYGGLLVLRAESQPAEGGSVSYEETAQKAALRRANENGDAQNESVLEVKVPYNSDGALTAQSAEGFGFGGWYMNDQLLSTESRYTSIFIDHTNLTAQFKQLYFDLTVDWNANRGTVTGAGTGKYSYGSNLSLVATPFEGYRFYQWEVNDEVPDDNPGSAYTHTVTGDATLSPLFLAETSSGLLLGDVKEDGNINVGDYTALVSLIVGTDGGRYLLETADHNGNKKADVGDLATEVNMIMDIGSFAANSLRHMGDNGVVQSEFDPDNRLYGPEMTLKAGDEVSVPLFLANKDEVSAFQTDIVLPDGLTLLDVAVAEERTTKLDHNLLVTSSKNGGTIRLLAGSSSNVSYRGAAGAVVMLRLRADEDMEDGEYIYQLKHTVLSSADSQIFHAPDCSMPMRIGNATGILTISPQAESAKGIYDVAGRKIANKATIDVVNRLPAGVYVVSGRKIVVR